MREIHQHTAKPEMLKPYGDYNLFAEYVTCEGECESCGLTFFVEIEIS